MKAVTHERRAFFGAAAAAAIAALAYPKTERQPTTIGGTMYGLIGKVSAVPGQREALAGVLLEGTQAMPGCLSYVIATDPTDGDALWITEVWESQASHKASLSLAAVQAAIAKGRPMIVGFGSRVETVPIGGHGLQAVAPR